MSVRGDTTVKLAGREIKLRLTLGAMAEIEDALGVPSINEALARVTNSNARAMMAMLSAMARAGGTPLGADEIAALDISEVAAALTGAINTIAPAEGAASADGEKKP